MEDQASNVRDGIAVPSSSSSVPSSSRVVEAERSISTNREAETEDSQHHHLHQRQRQSSRRSYRINFSISDIPPSEMRDDVWSCLVVLVTFWLFAASMTLILGFYGSVNLQLGPNGSRLIETNPYFVQYIQVEELDDSKPGPMLFGFSEHPPLSVEKTWVESHSTFIPANFHKEWMYFLNEGSEVEINYRVKSSLPLSFVIAEGRESLVEWIEDPSYPNTTLSWNIIYGSGRLQQAISKPAPYYIAVGNLNTDEVEVELNFTVKAWVYDTTNAYYRCSLGKPSCSLKLYLLKDNAAVLVSPPPQEGIVDDDWYVKLSYGPRWITYFSGSGLLTALILSAFRFFSMFQSSRDIGEGSQEDRSISIGTEQQAPLIPNKDDDLASWGSSYESVSHDEEEEDLEERFLVSSLEERASAAGENSSNPRGLCAICFDSPRDCFFLPCGHCAACFDCGSRIAEEDGSCPICWRKMKKVRKIFTV